MILIVDDDLAYAEAIQELLRTEVSTAQSEVFQYGASAIDWVLENGPPSVVILDMMIPFDREDLAGGRPPMNATELPRGIRIFDLLIEAGVERNRVIVITALITQVLSRRLLELKIPENHILFKPARAEQICRIVRTIHDRR